MTTMRIWTSYFVRAVSRSFSMPRSVVIQMRNATLAWYGGKDLGMSRLVHYKLV